MASDPTSPPSSGALPWWTRPSGINLLFILPLLIAVAWAGSSDFSEFALRTSRYLTAPYIGICVALVLASAAGAWLGENLRPHSILEGTDGPLSRATLVLGLLVIATYLFWFRTVFTDPAMLVQVFTGGALPDRRDIGTVTGVTSLVNLAPVFFGLAAYLLFVRRSRSPALIAITLAVGALTVFRTYLWAERLALAEAAIPMALALLHRVAPRPGQRLRRALYRLGPYAALPVVFLFFAASELFRSWSFYADRMGFWDFAWGRFVSYYYTSLNNGAGILSTTDWPDPTFQHVGLWLHKFPFGIGPAFSDLVGLDEANMQNPPTAASREFLRRYGDFEFNTPSSFLSVTYDLGVAGALVYFFFTMLAAGVLYARYAKGDLLSVMLYPSVLVALFESFRYPYWGTSRAFVWFLGSLAVLAVLWFTGGVRASAVAAGAAAPGARRGTASWTGTTAS